MALIIHIGHAPCIARRTHAIARFASGVRRDRFVNSTDTACATLCRGPLTFEQINLHYLLA